jgi:hypothetical protein
MNQSKTELMLSGPVGRTVLAELAGVTTTSVRSSLGMSGSEPVRSWNAGVEFVAAAAVAATRSVQDQVGADAFEPGSLLRRLGGVVEDYAFGRCQDWKLLQPVLEGALSQLRPLADAVVESATAEWWWATPPVHAQRWVGEAGSRPPGRGLTDLLAQAVQANGPPSQTREVPGSRSARGPWWSSLVDPRVLRTTREAPGTTEPTVFDCRDGHFLFGRDPVAVWDIVISSAARVFEVREARDWARLTEAYPRDVTGRQGRQWEVWSGLAGPWLLPDWLAAARDWDGVHVTVGGYLATSYQAVPAGPGLAYLAGWHPDETLWLRDVVSEVGWLGEVRPPGSS